MAAAALAAGLAPGAARAAQVAAFDGAAPGLAWGLPFAGLLLSIALLPLVSPRLWHHHQGKLTAAWTAAFLLPFALLHGVAVAGQQWVHALLAEYLPFVVLLAALYTTAGGIHVRGRLQASPALNTGLLAAGGVLASLMGTTGASMLLIRPLIRANAGRRHQVHVIVFFIFIVGNVGGSLTPLGDPPLFLGFLKGVDFGWPLRHLLPHVLLLVGSLLLVFHLLDRRQFAREPALPSASGVPLRQLRIEGGINALPLLAVLGLVLMSGLWRPGIVFDIWGTPVELQQLLRDAGLLLVIGLSLALTPRGVRAANQFSWGPMAEVAKLFAGIFLTMVPVLAMLRAGDAGSFAPLLRAVTGPDGTPWPVAYFWATGLLSSFLDNAPTYLVFFNLAGGDPQTLMGPLAGTLTAISAGAVFMGANTYIGNAPNFMIKAIAEDHGIRMPSFFGYMAWSGAILLPLFGLLSLIFFR